VFADSVPPAAFSKDRQMKDKEAIFIERIGLQTAVDVADKLGYECKVIPCLHDYKVICTRVKAWRSVKLDDELPETDEEVIALDKYGKIMLAHIVEDSFIAESYNGWDVPDVEYWMPTYITTGMEEEISANRDSIDDGRG
jgi:hypothetical protein